MVVWLWVWRVTAVLLTALLVAFVVCGPMGCAYLAKRGPKWLVESSDVGNMTTNDFLSMNGLIICLVLVGVTGAAWYRVDAENSKCDWRVKEKKRIRELVEREYGIKSEPADRDL